MDLLTLLRRCTREHHARLDAGIDFKRGRLAPARYTAFLRGVLSVVRPLEPALKSWFAAAGPSRTKCLLDDLASLGASCAVEPVAVRLPCNVAEAYGCAYVLEGSVLGGMTLAPAIENRLGPAVATSYLRLRGADTARTWRAWLAQLEQFGTTADECDAGSACEMACATFDSYMASLLLTGAIEEKLRECIQ